MQVYLALFTTTENKIKFLVGFKNISGWYFFERDRRNGDIIITLKSSPQPINGGGQYAFPGGKLNSSENVIDGAEREFFEETGVPIQLSANHLYCQTQFAVVFSYFEASELSKILYDANNILSRDLEYRIQNKNYVDDELEYLRILDYEDALNEFSSSGDTSWFATALRDDDVKMYLAEYGNI